MQRLIIKRDGTDKDVPKRRLAVRPAHFQHAARLRAAGHPVIGGALTDDGNEMIGPAAVAQFVTHAEPDAWREIEASPNGATPHYDLGSSPKSDASPGDPS